MNKKFKEKIKGAFGKEGFYMALVICLCVVVAAGTISYKTYINRNKTDNSNDMNSEVALNVDSKESSISNNEMQNAERVMNDVEKKEQDTKKDSKKDQNSNATVATASATTVNFINPITDGVESRKYTYPTPVKIDEETFRTIRGVNIQAKCGAEVKAAADGIVELVENSGVEEGMIVQIKHANGIKTRYGNLDVNVSVKQGDKVTANTVIGKVGSTAKVFDKETFGEFLNLQVINANGEQVNPEKYFTLKAK